MKYETTNIQKKYYDEKPSQEFIKQLGINMKGGIFLFFNWSVFCSTEATEDQTNGVVTKLRSATFTIAKRILR